MTETLKLVEALIFYAIVAVFIGYVAWCVAEDIERRIRRRSRR